MILIIMVLLFIFNPFFFIIVIILFLFLFLAGCITRDPRVVERKKEGQRKARARYTW